MTRQRLPAAGFYSTCVRLKLSLLYKKKVKEIMEVLSFCVLRRKTLVNNKVQNTRMKTPLCQSFLIRVFLDQVSDTKRQKIMLKIRDPVNIFPVFG